MRGFAGVRLQPRMRRRDTGASSHWGAIKTEVAGIVMPCGRESKVLRFRHVMSIFLTIEGTWFPYFHPIIAPRCEEVPYTTLSLVFGMALVAASRCFFQHARVLSHTGPLRKNGTRFTIPGCASAQVKRFGTKSVFARPTSQAWDRIGRPARSELALASGSWKHCMCLPSRLF
jgi:hypothetical protein